MSGTTSKPSSTASRQPAFFGSADCVMFSNKFFFVERMGKTFSKLVPFAI